MKPVTPQSETSSWRRELQVAIRDPDALCDALGLPDGLRPAARAAAARFPVVVPRAFLARMRPGDPDDPLLRQVLPLEEELASPPGFVEDPVGDRRAEIGPGLLQKYAGRALVVATGECAVDCRYCFRRHYDYAAVPKGTGAWSRAIAAIAADPTIDEVILSGGDPLVLTERSLARWTEALSAIPHVRRLRVHSRLPIVLPARVDDALLEWLRSSRLTPWMVVHANHPAEIDDACAAALGRLVDAGVPTLNQAVLLAGVNDDADVLTELCSRLVDLRVQPYYLHQLDPVAGAAHFRVSDERGLEIVRELARRLPGYAVPRFVREIPGAAHKVDVVPR